MKISEAIKEKIEEIKEAKAIQKGTKKPLLDILKQLRNEHEA
jgi:hypothetical protein